MGSEMCIRDRGIADEEPGDNDEGYEAGDPVVPQPLEEPEQIDRLARVVRARWLVRGIRGGSALNGGGLRLCDGRFRGKAAHVSACYTA